jgi:TolB-like protein
MVGKSIKFGPFEFDCASGTLSQNGELVPLGGRGAALLQALLEAEGAVVRKEVLIERAWPDVIVEEGNLAVQIGALRRLLGNRADGLPWIETAARSGYRLAHDIAGKGLPAIAVLPFVATEAIASFADGFVEDLITALSRFSTFAVVARTSTEAFRGKGMDAREIARDLGVRYLVEGSVRRTGDSIRLTAQLIDGDSGLHLWSEKLDGTLEGIFDFQDRLVARVVVMFEPQIRRAEIERARRKRPGSLDAYDLYLTALPLLRGVHVYRPEHFDEAIAILEQAIALDPGFAPALALCAAAHEIRLTTGGTAPPGVDDAAEALRLVELALLADGNDPMVLMQAASMRLVLAGDEATSFPLLERAQELNPNSLLIANVAAYCFWHVGRIEEAIERNMHALTLAPMALEAAWTMNALASAHMSAGRVEEALRWGLRVLERTDGIASAHCVVAAAYAHLGRQAEAEARMRRALGIWPELSLKIMVGSKKAPRAQFQLYEEGLVKAGLPAG